MVALLSSWCLVTVSVHLQIQRGDRGSRPPTPLENDKNIGFLSNTGPDPLKITNLSSERLMYNVGPSSAI